MVNQILVFVLLQTTRAPSGVTMKYSWEDEWKKENTPEKYSSFHSTKTEINISPVQEDFVIPLHALNQYVADNVIWIVIEKRDNFCQTVKNLICNNLR